jgi:hypothetical protein
MSRGYSNSYYLSSGLCDAVLISIGPQNDRQRGRIGRRKSVCITPAALNSTKVQKSNGNSIPPIDYTFFRADWLAIFYA